jgi:hypothetical protein
MAFTMQLFPRNYIVVYDMEGRLIDYALYYNKRKCWRAHARVLRPQPDGFYYLYREDGSYEGVAYRRSAIKAITSSIREVTFYGLSEEQLRQMASQRLPFEVLNAAAKHERYYLRNPAAARGDAFRRKYIWSIKDFFPSRK